MVTLKSWVTLHQLSIGILYGPGELKQKQWLSIGNKPMAKLRDSLELSKSTFSQHEQMAKTGERLFPPYYSNTKQLPTEWMDKHLQNYTCKENCERKSHQSSRIILNPITTSAFPRYEKAKAKDYTDRTRHAPENHLQVLDRILLTQWHQTKYSTTFNKDSMTAVEIWDPGHPTRHLWRRT